MKTIQTAFLFCCTVLACGRSAQAQFTYITNNGTITITGYTGPNGAVTIPTNINGLPVTTIGTNAFEGKGITSITIPNSITTIGDNAFASSFLNSITIPNSVGAVGTNALGNCLGLTNATIGSGVTSIGDYAFFNCFDLKGLTLGTNVASIGAYAFCNCFKLGTVTLPASLGCIGAFAFYCASDPDTYIGSPTNIMIGSSVTNIGVGAFSFCIELTEITVDAQNSFYSSTNGVLFDKSQTTLIAYPGGLGGSYTIPASITSIGAYAFSHCFFLTSVTIPNSVTNIGNYAFYASSDETDIGIGLTNVVVPYSVINIGEEAFSDCMGLTAITVDTQNSFYSSTNGVLFDKSQTTLITYPNGLFGGYSIPSSVTSIGAYAFADCGTLNSVVIPDSVTNIGQYAFYDCCLVTGGPVFGLTTIVIPDNVTSIGAYAFAECGLLTNVNFQGNAPSFGSDVFDGDSPTIYTLPGTTGWGATGLQTALWNPLIQTSGTYFGLRNNQFGFDITATNNFTVVVEACTNLANPVWQPLQTNTLNNGSFYFSDSQWANYPIRYYRLSPP